MQQSDIQVDIAIIGAGTAGMNALREIRNAGKSFVLIDHGPLGTTCARVGCMPSKAALHAGGLWQGHAFAGNAERDSAHVNPQSLWRGVREIRDRLAGGAAQRTVAAAGEHLLTGRARFVAPHTLDVDGRRVTADAFVIATGSRPVLPAFLREMEDRVLTTDSLFERDTLPRSIGMLGLGAIGLEIGLALSKLGVRVIAADIKDAPAGIADPDIAAQATRHFGNAERLTMWLGRAAEVARSADGVAISSGGATEQVECVLAALGRQPAIDGLRLDLAGVQLDERGQPSVDPHCMRAAGSALYFAGDVNPGRALMHEAVDEGSIAGWNAAHHGTSQRFQRRTPLSIVFSDPDIAAVGLRHDQLDLEQTIIGSASGQANGRSRILGAEQNLVRLYADRADGRLLGAALFAVRGEHLAHLLAWAIQRGETAASLLEMPFYHPTVEEMVQSALSDIVRQQGGVRAGPPGLPALVQQSRN